MTDIGQLMGRGISFPPRIGPDGRVAFSAGPDNVAEAIQVILLTELQERIMLPSFGGGLQPFLFQPNIPSTHKKIQDRITQALAQWEPRVTVQSVTVSPDPVDMQTAVATISYKLVATQVSSQTAVSIKLQG